jgi:hypothetical protein
MPLFDKAAHELMPNPSGEELDAADIAALDLVEQVKRIGASALSYEIPDGQGHWALSIEWKPDPEAKPN